jgi:fumarate hydratase class II
MRLDRCVKIREEKDSLGVVAVPIDCYWGAQTQRAYENFDIGDEKFSPALIRALAIIKKAAARANYDFGILELKIADVISSVADDIIAGNYYSQFPLSVWQSGSGTQSNMNMNEVIANLAIERLGGEIGTKIPVHPNDHVNKSQSSNDVFPTAMHIALVEQVRGSLLNHIKGLYDSLLRKSLEFQGICKIGRTHLQDAVPLTLGQEFSGYAEQVGDNIARIETALCELYAIALGGTAVGTGLNAPDGFGQKVAAFIADITGVSFVSGKNKFALQAAHDGCVSLSSALNTLAVSLLKIVNDIRLLGSGPRCGLGELFLPQNELGSSIMPGKINPTQCESLTMVCYRVIGNHTAVTMAGAGGHFELNACKPVMIYSVLQSVTLLSDGMRSFTEHCIEGVAPNIKKINQYAKESLMLVTALAPSIGYDACAKLAGEAHKNGTTLEEENERLGLMPNQKFREMMDVQKMVHENLISILKN